MAAEKNSDKYISSILAAGAIAAGAGQAGSVILLGGQQLGTSRFYHFPGHKSHCRSNCNKTS